MTTAVPDILARIVAHKKAELEQANMSLPELEQRAEAAAADRRDFAAALRSRRPAMIAEIKKASPSKGLLTPDFQPAVNAAEYEAGGAAALSVLTDERFFQGGLDDLQSGAIAVGMPALRKDFTISEYHVIEAAAHGADAILLIAAILTPATDAPLSRTRGAFGMAALVEVHDDGELDAALESGPDDHRREQSKSPQISGHARDVVAARRTHSRWTHSSQRERYREPRSKSTSFDEQDFTRSWSAST